MFYVRNKIGKKAYDKSVTYLMRMYSTQLDIGVDYDKLKSYYQFNLSERIIKKIGEENDSLISMYPFGISGIGKDVRMYLVKLDFNKELDYNESRLGEEIGSDRKQKEMILRMNERNMDINEIAEICNLSVEEVQKIIDEVKEDSN